MRLSQYPVSHCIFMLVSASIAAFLIICLLVDILLRKNVSLLHLFIYISIDLTDSYFIQYIYGLLLPLTIIILMLKLSQFWPVG